MYMRTGEHGKSAEAWYKAYHLDQQYSYPKTIADRLMVIPDTPDSTARIVHFRLDGYLNAHFVALSGPINNWNDGIQPLHYLKNPELNKDNLESILELK